MMNREQIIKMLETIDEVGDCSRDCIFYNGKVHSCGGTIAKHALALIKELTEECKDFKIRALRAENEAAKYKDRWETSEKDFKRLADNAAEINRLTEKLIPEIKADTVKKMQEKIRAKSEYGSINISPWQLDQIAEEMLED
jgi:hypothetical protein